MLRRNACPRCWSGNAWTAGNLSGESRYPRRAVMLRYSASLVPERHEVCPARSPQRNMRRGAVFAAATVSAGEHSASSRYSGANGGVPTRSLGRKGRASSSGSEKPRRGGDDMKPSELAASRQDLCSRRGSTLNTRFDAGTDELVRASMVALRLEAGDGDIACSTSAP